MVESIDASDDQAAMESRCMPIEGNGPQGMRGRYSTFV